MFLVKQREEQDVIRVGVLVKHANIAKLEEVEKI
jgi:hypothetical protein